MGKQWSSPLQQHSNLVCSNQGIAHGPKLRHRWISIFVSNYRLFKLIEYKMPDVSTATCAQQLQMYNEIAKESMSLEGTPFSMKRVLQCDLLSTMSSKFALKP